MSLVGQSATIVEQFSYDPSFGDLTAVEFSRSGQLLYRYSIELRDNLGREKIRRETFASPTGPQETRLRYDYDLAGRLSKVFSCPLTGDPLCTASPVEKSSFSYDDNGNLTAFPTLLAPAYDAQDRLFSSSGSSFVNNAEGWRTQTTVSTLSFSHAYHPSGSLASTQGFQGTASYRLDPLGRRIERSAGPTPASLSFSSRFLYRDALRPAAELTSSNTLRSRFVYTSGRNVPDFFWRDGSLFRIVTDPRGSVR
nr:hypothetical protein [Polyangiaceae bacterium]